MKHIKTIAALCILLPVAAFAQASTPRVEQRQVNQQARIEQGVNSGSLTPREAMRLERGQRHVEHMALRAKSDGVVTRHERANLQHAQNVQSQRIYDQKHDRQHDYNHNGRVDRLASRR